MDEHESTLASEANGEIPEETPLSPGERFGDYEIERYLGRGGTGIVYLARHAGVHPIVALKVIRAGAESSRFSSGANKAAELVHPNIVRVYHVGMHENRAFYTMQYVSDRNLGHVIPELRGAPTEVAILLAKVARAVEAAHERRLLHRDLKPSNILVEARGESFEPFVADFDLAKRLSPSGNGSASALIGTLNYMSPEQLDGVTRLNEASDVYALGVILYEILTTKVPFPTRNVAEKLMQIRSTPPRPPSAHGAVDEHLERICLRCLSKRPQDRYPSARAVAEELERVARTEPIETPRLSVPARAHSWIVWNRPLAYAIAVAVWSLLWAGLLYVVKDHQESERLEDISYAATGQAANVMQQLQQNGQRVHELAENPEVIALLDAPTPDHDCQVLRDHATGFTTVFLARVGGTIWAQWPEPPQDIRGRDYTWRDYFKGATALARQQRHATYLARAFLSESDRMMQFGFSAPVYKDGVAAGVLIAAQTVGPAFQAAGVVAPSVSGYRAALLGPRDIDRGGKAFPSDFTLLVHPSLAEGQAVALAPETSAALLESFGPRNPPGNQFVTAYQRPMLDQGYPDPTDPAGDDWLAAFAPIGKTGYLVAVQATRSRMSWSLAFELGLAAATLFLLHALWTQHRRS